MNFLLTKSPLKILTLIISSFVIIQTNSAVSSSLIESELLLNLQNLNEISKVANFGNRRSSILEPPTTDNVIVTDSIEIAVNQLQSPQSPSSISNISTTFDSTHEPPLATDTQLTNTFEDLFTTIHESPADISIQDFSDSINTIVTKKGDYGMSNRAFLSAVKSMMLAYVRTSEKSDEFKSIPGVLLSHILPNIGSQEWGESGSSWIKSLSQITVESFLESKNGADLPAVVESFSSNIVELLTTPTGDTLDFFDEPISITVGDDESELEISEDKLEGLKASGIFIGQENILLDRSDLSNPPDETDDITFRNDSSEDMKRDGLSGFDPIKSQPIQQLAVGVTQGYLGSTGFDEDQLTMNDINLFSGQLNGSGGSAVEAFINGMINQLNQSENEMFFYEAMKASANGFLLATTVATTSSPDYIDNEFHLEVAEKIAQSVSKYAILHKTLNEETEEVSYTVASDSVDIQRLAESIAHGSSMGSQLATVLPKSMEFTDSWEISNNLRRELARVVAKGNSFGAVDSSATLSLIPKPTTEEIDGNTEEFVIESNQVEKAAQGSSLGSMMGNTGLAIYYPTDQLVPIINFTAQGSAFGSISSPELSGIKNKNLTESIDVGIARQSALGSAIGATFEPTVLLGLRPDLRNKDPQTIDHLSAAAFGATYGAILGIDVSSQGASNIANLEKRKEMLEIQQSTKQGSIEGALIGAKLSLGLDEVTPNTLKSKSEMIKAIDRANKEASASSSNNVGNVNSLQTSSKDMLLLMNKFGINPRFTNPAKMYKRPVIVQNDEPILDIESNNSVKSASPI